MRKTSFHVLSMIVPMVLGGCSGESGQRPVPIATPTATATLVAAVPSGSANAPMSDKPGKPIGPVAKKDPVVKDLFGRKLVDDYAWLRKKDTPEVLAHLRAEEAYAQQMTAHLASLRERIYQEMRSRMKETDEEVPYKDGAYFYYSRTEQGKQYPIFCRKAVKGGDKAPEQILLDLNEIGKTEKFVNLGPKALSDDGKLLAYGLDKTGFRQFTLHIKDLSTGKELPDRIERLTSVVFSKDGKTIFYTVEDPVAKRSYRLYRHELGTDPAKDALVFEEKDERFTVAVNKSTSKKLILLEVESHTTTEAYFIPADKPKDKLTLVAAREQDHEYYVDHRGEELIIRTNSAAAAEGAKSTNFRLMVTKVSSPGKASWKETIAHRPEVMLESVELFKDFAVVMEREDGLRQIRILDAKKLSLEGSHRVVLPEQLSAMMWSRNAEFDQSFYRFKFASPTTPWTTYDYEPKKRTLTVKKRQEVPNYEASRYEAKRIHAVAKDGTKVPISLLYRKGTAMDGKNPTYIYGYGSYGAPMFPWFNSGVFSLVDRGVVCAIAHIRGGGEMGEIWHEAGRMKNKMNTFTDFISATEALIEQGWADKKRIAIQGASAGGLLMGAVTNMRPDLYRAVIADVPFVDVINTMLDESLPLTVGEFEEWGNPKKEEEFRWMIQYSPYDNVERKAYPSILVNTSYNDSQVMYWEPAKWVAKLREMKTDANPLLLHILLDPAGHGGKSGRYEQMEENAFDDAWLLEQLGATELVAAPSK